jgi:hypothetical protein
VHIRRDAATRAPVTATTAARHFVDASDMPTTSRTASRFSLLRFLVVPALLILATAGVTHGASQTGQRILVFSKTAGFRHESIEAGIAAIRKLGQENGIAVDATEDATAFTDANL